MKAIYKKADWTLSQWNRLRYYAEQKCYTLHYNLWRNEVEIDTTETDCVYPTDEKYLEKYFEIGLKKHLRLIEVAIENNN